ncbi:unnamed protein product [Brassica napus]|uniref:(rape) hypothetical protein n=1 Tax=Brassica napus TaxID=3708 RepID=A0A816I0Z0_BRANA|nr:unnamed protein product [Brassica napus]
MASDGFRSVWVFRDRSGFAVLWFCLCLHVTGLLHLLCLLMGAPPPPLLKEWSCCISGVSNVWSGLRRLRLPDQGLVSPASPVLLSESPSGRSAVPQTVLRLRTLLITSLVAGTGGKIEL